MKKGCFLKLLFIVTLSVGAISYIITNKLDEFVITPVRQFTLKLTLGEAEEQLHKVRNSTEKKQLLEAIDGYKKDVWKMRTLSLNSLGAMADSLKKLSADSIITNAEVENFYKFLVKVKEDEKRKKD